MPIKLANAEDEYAKYKELRKEDVEALQQWIEKQPQLPKLTDLQVIQFFQSCYFKTEATKTTIDTYFSLKFYWPEYFTNRDPNLPQLQQIMDISLITVLPERTPEGYIVILATLVNYDSNLYNFLQFIRLFDMVGMVWLCEHGSAEGVVFVLDLAHTTLAHLSSITISAMKNMFVYLQEALPSRLKGMHFVNTGVVMDKLMILMKPFMKKELLDVLYLHAKVGDSFYRYVPQNMLPAEYGGTAPSMATLHADMKKILLDNVECLTDLENLKGDENKRIDKSNGAAHGYGLDGSFKKLDID